MIYGDAISQTDSLGLTNYAYRPNISAVMQSGNLYVYCVNNPIIYLDSTGKVVEIMHYKNPDRLYGHIDIAINDKIYSYAAYGFTSATLINIGSIMIVDKNDYINVRSKNGDVITGFVIKTTPKQEENLLNVLNSYISGVEPYYLEDDKYNGIYYNGKWNDNLAIYSALNNGGLNCVAFTGKALAEANINVQTIFPVLNQNIVSLPCFVKKALMNSYNKNSDYYGSVIDINTYETHSASGKVSNTTVLIM